MGNFHDAKIGDLGDFPLSILPKQEDRIAAASVGVAPGGIGHVPARSGAVHAEMERETAAVASARVSVERIIGFSLPPKKSSLQIPYGTPVVVSAYGLGTLSRSYQRPYNVCRD